VLSALLNTGMRIKFSKIDGYGTVFTAPSGAEGYTTLHELTGQTKVDVLSAFAASFRVSRTYLPRVVNTKSIQPCWLIGCIALACALMVSSPSGYI